MQLYKILDNNCNLKDAALMPDHKYPLERETNAIQNAIEGKISRLVAKAHGKSIEGCTQKLRPTLGLFNINDRIVFKQKRLLFIYRLINESRTITDCWLNPRLILEKEVLDLTRITCMTINSTT